MILNIRIIHIFLSHLLKSTLWNCNFLYYIYLYSTVPLLSEMNKPSYVSPVVYSIYKGIYGFKTWNWVLKREREMTNLNHIRCLTNLFKKKNLIIQNELNRFFNKNNLQTIRSQLRSHIVYTNLYQFTNLFSKSCSQLTMVHIFLA